MHTRGRRGDTMVAAGISGTTHAHAGQTAARLAIKFSSWNHPCTRGADLGALNIEPRTGEPPMHTRGRHEGVRKGAVQTGNHPCTRGADQHDFLTVDQLAEPPMHTRGRLGVSCYKVFWHGTTHAHAGQTVFPLAPNSVERNHPCTRGADAC